MSRPSERSSVSRLSRPAALTVAGLMLVAVGFHATISTAQEGIAIPAPRIDEAATSTGMETAVFAGGCFWGVQGVFQHVNGVVNATSGYAGGDRSSAQYEMVSTGTTGHAESVQVVFDPKKVSYGHLLQIYFSVAHDPTELNRQGPDTGTQYRSAIFPADAEQARVAKSYIEQLNHEHVYDAAVVTRIEPQRTFYPAEQYHQDFLNSNPTYPYIVYNDLPKIDNLKRLFPKDFRSNPVLVADNGK